MGSAPRPVFITETQDRILAQALARCERNAANNSVDEDILITNIQALLPFDAITERFNKAVRFYKRATKPNGTKANGQLWLPGLELPYKYEPLRLISNGEGQTVEQDKALSEFKERQVIRSEQNLLKVQEAHKRVVGERDQFREWTLEQLDAGRRLTDITFGNCVRETGMWQPKPEADEVFVEDDEREDD